MNRWMLVLSTIAPIGGCSATPISPPPPPPDDGIAAARAADTGSTNLPITGVTVTYLKPTLGFGSDPAGFTIQHAQAGPALFVYVDPATLSPTPVVGGVVGFTITRMATIGWQPRAMAITNYRRQSTGASVTALTQDVSNDPTLATAYDNFDSEIVTVSGSIATAFGPSDPGYQSATFSTPGVFANAVVRLHVPTRLIDSLALVAACQLTARQIPVAGVNATFQFSVYRAADLSVTSCPAPTERR